MKKHLLITIILTLTSAILLSKTHANAAFSNQERIDKYDVSIAINKDGSIDVTEKIDYFFYLPRHGIFRNIPFVKVNEEGKEFKLNISAISITDSFNVPYKYTKKVDGKDIVLKVGDANKTIEGPHTYVIKYKVFGALTYFSDHDELYWNITGNEWDVPVVTAFSTILLPKEINMNGVSSTCYTGPKGSSDRNCFANLNGNSVFSSVEGPLFSSEGLTVP